MIGVRWVAAGLVAMALMTGGLTSAQTIQVNKDNRTIAITTTDEAEAVADRAKVSVGFTVYGTDQDSTYDGASKTSNVIMQTLKDAGIRPEAIESRDQSLREIDDNDKVRYEKGIRFVFSQGWTVTVPAKDAADVLHLAITAGANNSGNISWELQDEKTLQSEAAAKALAHAQQIAEGMAKGLHTTLGPLLYASNEAPLIEGRGYGLAGGVGGGVRHKNLKPLALSPAKITKSATVYAVFALE